MQLSMGAERFIRAVTEFVFVEDAPEKADVIFIPGSRKIHHVLRAAEDCHAAMPDTRFLVCPVQTPGCTRDDWYRTEKGRARVLGEVQRLGSQVSEVFSMMLEE